MNSDQPTASIPPTEPHIHYHCQRCQWSQSLPLSPNAKDSNPLPLCCPVCNNPELRFTFSS
ncbi:hypothetical protein P6F15_07520 [Thiopseudomonas alkaliphila]|uniref:hypothetical protein n=1 Tax=Thiopseudomonas alkaliphila TaxID=1697053 RepID=UPI00357102AE